MGEMETIDKLLAWNLHITQPRSGYRFSLDSLLLSDYCGVNDGERVIDLGTGCGVIPLILARKSGTAEIVGVEFQKDMAGLAERNVMENRLAEQIEIVCADILSLKGKFPVSSFDLVVANPPYRPQGTGKVSPRPGRDLARHETTACLADFMAVAKYLVRPSGRICFIYHVSRLFEFIAEARGQKLAPLRMRFVHSSLGSEARMFLIELRKGRKGELQVLSPMVVDQMER